MNLQNKMEKTFSKHWASSKQPRKQRKYVAKAPLHIKRKFVGTNLSKDLRKKHGQRNIPVKKGDTVKIMRGKFAKKEGKILSVSLKQSKVTIEGIGRVRMIPGFHDEPLKGDRKGQRSVRLSKSYRAIYQEIDGGLVVWVVEINKHEY